MAEGRLVYKDRIGRVRVAVFQHQNGQGSTWYNTEVGAFYKDGDLWKPSSYQHHELPIAEHFMRDAYSFIWSCRQGEPSDQETGAVVTAK